MIDRSIALRRAPDQWPAGSTTNIIYLACPYTDKDPKVRLSRFELATAAAATLVRRGFIVFSPITMTHPLDVVLAGCDTLGSDFWVQFDRAFMDKCSEIVVLQIEGWDHSSGVRREIEYFKQCGKRVSFMRESDIEINTKLR
jgi:hypothetical protein